MAHHESFLAAYQRYAEAITDASPDYHRFMALGTMGVLLGNRVYLPWGDTYIYPNMWMIFLGVSTWDHKTTAIMISKRLLDQWNKGPNLIYPNDFSYEALVKTYAKKPVGAHFFSEFKTFMGLLNRDYNAPAKGFLADIFDAPYSYRKELSGSTITIDHPAISIFAATTTAWFLDNLKESDIEAGLIPRFVYIPSRRKGADKPRPPMACKETRKMLHELADEFASIKGPCYLTEGAGERHDEWYRKMRNIAMSGGDNAPFIGRLQAYLIKFAIVLQVDHNRRLKIEEGTMNEAVNLCNWLYKEWNSVSQNEIAFGKTNQDAKKIRNALTAGPLDRRTLLRKTHLSSQELDNAIRTMEDREDLEKYRQKAEGSRKPSQFYKLLD